jgi:ketohexokinase
LNQKRRILGVGIATLDLINEVDRYPPEDAEVRAIAQRRTRGGNATNSLAVLAQLGHRCHWRGTLADDAASEDILEALAREGIDTSGARRLPNTTTPTSYITLSRANGSRTIVHYRDLPELDAEGFASVPLEDFDWVHFEGRHPQETQQMLRHVRRERPAALLSVELEKPRPGIEALLDGPHLLLASRAYALATGFEDPECFLRDLMARTTADLGVVGWGAQGATYLARSGSARHVPAYPPVRVMDTLGAGDCLNAAVIDGWLRGLDPQTTLTRAVRLAGFKCGRHGLDGLIWDAEHAEIL